MNAIQIPKTVHRDVRIGTPEEYAQAISDYPNDAGMFNNSRYGYYVGFYNNPKKQPGTVYYIIESWRDSQWATSCGFFDTGREYTTEAEAVEASKTFKNRERRILRMTYTGRYIGSDESGMGCIENGYRREIIGERRFNYSQKKWYSKGILAA
jgi:hypothetical protein